MSSITDVRGFLIDLRTAAWRTAGDRYNAARRLRQRDWLSTFSIASFSAIGVALAFVAKAFGIEAGSAVDNYINTLALCIGLSVIVISLAEWGRGHILNAEMLYRNAEQLGEFHRKIALTLATNTDGSIDAQVAEALRQEYEHIKKQCSANHEPVDDLLFKARYRRSPEFLLPSGKPEISLPQSIWINIVGVLDAVWYFGLLWLVILYLVFVIAQQMS
jgi:hypothetical protein